MTVRPGWDLYFMRFAYLAATRATCSRKHVGAVIVSPDHRAVSTGYNGAPMGAASCDEVGHEMVEGHCIRTLHAESNALDFAGRFAMGCTLYVTVTPCYDCAKRIVNAQINRVVYDSFYNSRYDKSGSVDDFLSASGVEVCHFDDSGLTLFKKKMEELEAIEREILSQTLIEYVCGCTVSADKATRKCPEHGKARA